MVTASDILKLGFLGAIVYTVLKLPRNSVSESSIEQKLSIPSIDLSKPLPFKTIQQQKAEFKPEYKQVEIFSTNKRFFSGGSINRYINSVRDVYGRDLIIKVGSATSNTGKAGAQGISFYKNVQTNTFNPSLTRYR